MPSPFRPTLKSTGLSVLAALVLLTLSSACNSPMETAKNYAQDAELAAQTASTIDEWKAVDTLWVKVMQSLDTEKKHKNKNEDYWKLYGQASKGRLDAILEVRLLDYTSPGCGTEAYQEGRNEPHYLGYVGYITVSPWSDRALYEQVKMSFEDKTARQKNWPVEEWAVDTVLQNKESPDQTVPMGTRVQVIKTSLKHTWRGSYKGNLQVRDIYTKASFWIDHFNFSFSNPSICFLREANKYSF